MTGRYYDVIVLGRSMGALLAAALLARRDFSVLVLGQGTRPATYAYGPHALRRRAFSLLGASSPALRRALVELAQSQTFRRLATPLDPMLSILMPGKRFELPPDLPLFEREIDREFPEVRRVLDDLYAMLARVNEAADLAFANDVALPPGTFWERHKAKSFAQGIPFLDTGGDPLSDLPLFHPYRSIVEQTVAFASNAAFGHATQSAFALARLHGSWTRGIISMPGGEDELEKFLVERVTAHGGVVALNERAERIAVQRDGVAGVYLDGDTSRTGCQFLLSTDSGEDLAKLASNTGLTPRAQREWPRVTPAARRYVLSLVIHRAGVPDPLGAESLVFGSPPGTTPDPQRPVVRLQRADLGRAATSEPATSRPTLLVAETLLPVHGGLSPQEARDAVLGTLRQYFPWLDRHLVVVDSPHDGRAVWAYENGQRTEIDRIHLIGGSLRPEAMDPLYEVAAPSFFGLAGEPLRGPIARTFLLGKTVLPALGQEGELLAACGVARLVTKSDPRREKLRLEMWNKVEIG